MRRQNRKAKIVHLSNPFVFSEKQEAKCALPLRLIIGLEETGDRRQIGRRRMREAADHERHVAAEGVARRRKAGRKRFGYVVLRPVLEPLRGDVRRLAPAVQKPPAGQSIPLDDRAQEIVGRVAFGAVSGSLDQIAAERLLAGRGDRGGIDLRHVEKVPESNPATDREWEIDLVRRRAPGNRRRRAQEGVEIAHVLHRHARIGRVGHRRIEMPQRWRDARHHGVGEVGGGPRSDTVGRIGRDIGGMECAERRFHRESAAEAQRVLLTRRHVAGIASGDEEDIFSRRRVARLGDARRDRRVDAARRGDDERRDGERQDGGRKADRDAESDAHGFLAPRLARARLRYWDALYFSWQPPQLLSTPGIAVLKLASSLMLARAAAASAPNVLKRASKSAMLLSSQIAGRAVVLFPVLLSGGNSVGSSFAAFSKVFSAFCTAARSNAALPLSMSTMCFAATPSAFINSCRCLIASSPVTAASATPPPARIAIAATVTLIMAPSWFSPPSATCETKAPIAAMSRREPCARRTSFLAQRVKKARRPTAPLPVRVWRWDRADLRARQKAPLAAVVEREHAAAPGHGVDDEVGVFPDLVLRGADIEGRAADLAELHVVVADEKIALTVAHRRGAVAAAARLMEEHRTVLGEDLGARDDLGDEAALALGAGGGRDRMRAAPHPKPAEERAHMRLYRRFGEAELVGDELVRQARDEKVEGALLRRAQGFEPFAKAAGGRRRTRGWPEGGAVAHRPNQMEREVAGVFEDGVGFLRKRGARVGLAEIAFHCIA